jgi:broad specificity phosphatase PhoE
MKKRLLTVLPIVVFAAVFTYGAYGQSKVIVLVRHAEKDTSVANDPDPALSIEGLARAKKLEKAVRRFKPYEIFSTNTRRTRQTAEPIAERRRKPIQTYDASKHQELIGRILASRRRHFLVVGHSNTVPFLANLLVKKEVFRQVPDSEHGIIWVIRLRRGALKRLELYTY